jgi:SRSO17 transposase
MDVAQIRALKPRLDNSPARFEDCFSRCDTREHLAVHVTGPPSDLAQKSVGPIAPAAGIPPRTPQEFLARYKWDENALRRRLHHTIARDHACPRGVGLIGETSDTKKGVKAPGVQRQHCGAVGKQDNCAVTVHLGYAADDLHTPLDGELFLPESWSSDRPRWREAGIPGAMVYRPKTEIALDLYGRAVAHGVPFGWLAFDEWSGTKPAVLQALGARGQKFVGEVHKDFVAGAKLPRVTDRPYRRGNRGRPRRTPRLVAGSPKPTAVDDVLRYHAPLRDRGWVRYRVKGGATGPMVWEAKSIPISPRNEHGRPQRAYRLVVTRDVLAPDAVKYFVSNAPSDAPLPALLLVAFSRWRVERCFEDEKGELGPDHDEGRKYRGLKRHTILAAVSRLFLAAVHQDLRGEKPGADGVPAADGDVGVGEGPVAFRTRWGAAA